MGECRVIVRTWSDLTWLPVLDERIKSWHIVILFYFIIAARAQVFRSTPYRYRVHCRTFKLSVHSVACSIPQSYLMMRDVTSDVGCLSCWEKDRDFNETSRQTLGVRHAVEKDGDFKETSRQTWGVSHAERRMGILKRDVTWDVLCQSCWEKNGDCNERRHVRRVVSVMLREEWGL